MPNKSIHKTEAHVRLTIPLIRYLQSESLTGIEYNLVLYIFERSLNFKEVRNGGNPIWVEMSPSAYAEEFGFHRVRVSRALSRLEYLGIFDVVLVKRGGQEYKNFKVIDSDKIGKVLSDLVYTNSVKPSETVSKKLQSTVSKKLQLKVEKINDKSLDCINARYGHVVIFDTSLYQCALRPCIVSGYSELEIADKFRGITNFQECIKHIKEYFKNNSNFSSPSYFELLLSSIRTRKERRNLSITLKRSVDHYGLFSVWIAINAHLKNEKLHFTDFSVLTAILKKHKNEMDEVWENVLLQLDNLFYELIACESECDSKMQNFKIQAQLRLTSKRTQEEKPLVFFFDSFEESALSAYEVSNGNIDSFKEKMVKKINLYFKSKILGQRELIHDEIMESLLE